MKPMNDFTPLYFGTVKHHFTTTQPQTSMQSKNWNIKRHPINIPGWRKGYCEAKTLKSLDNKGKKPDVDG